MLAAAVLVVVVVEEEEVVVVVVVVVANRSGTREYHEGFSAGGEPTWPPPV